MEFLYILFEVWKCMSTVFYSIESCLFPWQQKFYKTWFVKSDALIVKTRANDDIVV